MQVSVAEIKAKFTAIALQADAGEEVIITNRGKPAYRLLPILKTCQRTPFPDLTDIALKSKPQLTKSSFVADWRSDNERF